MSIKYSQNFKEGTRNYSKFISNPIFWNLNNFIIKKNFKMHNLNFTNFRQFFNLVNLEIFYRYCYLKNTKGIEEILSNKGKKTFNL